MPPRVKSVAVSGFTGLDLRLSAEGAPPSSLRVATNVDLSTGGAVRARDQLRLIADVSGTLGLYVVGGKLRCAVPRSGSIPTAPPRFAYDVFSSIEGNDPGTATAVTGVQSWNGVPYIVVKRTDTLYEHHYFESGNQKTIVDLPFTTGPNLFAVSRKIVGHDIATNQVWFSSTLNGPRNWTESGDAGYISVAQHAPGDTVVRGFAIYGGNTCIFFKDSVQVWRIAIDPADNELIDVIGGAGTANTYSIANVLGDPIYFAQGGFRSLSVTAVTGQSNDSDIGAPIYPETKTLTLTGTKPVSIWSSSRSQYMCAIGNTIYVFTNSPASDRKGWTKYTTQVAVTDMVELDGEVYVRAGDGVYKFDSNYTGESGFTWTARFPFNAGEGDLGVRKQWVTIEAAMSGTANLTYRYWPRNDALTASGPRLTGSTFGVNHIPIGLVSESLSVEFSGTSAMTLDGFVLRYRAGQS